MIQRYSRPEMAALWSNEARAGGFTFDDVSATTAAQLETRPVAEAFSGRAVVAGYTVLHDKGRAARALVLADTDTGCRALAASEDPVLAGKMQTAEFCGARIHIDAQCFTLA